MAFDRIRSLFKDKAEHRPLKIPPPAVRIALPDEDDDEEFGASCDGEEALGWAEGQSFIIDYLDSKGKLSTRRITVWGIKYGKDDMPVLVAQCHERKQRRTFRIDRIKTVYDSDDGTAQHNVARFLVEAFGMAPELAHLCEGQISTGQRPRGQSVKPKRSESSGASPEIVDSAPPKAGVLSDRERLIALRTMCRHRGVQLLWCFAEADGDFRPTELSAIKTYIADCAADENISITAKDLEALTLYIKRLRPDPRTIDRDVDSLAKASNLVMTRFLNGCVAVAQADGKIHPAEIQAVNTISQELVGRDIL